MRNKVGFRRLVVTIGAVLVAGGLALPVAIFFGDQNRVVAQTQPAPGPAAPKPAAPATPGIATAPPAPSVPVRTETITYDSWTVGCRDKADGKTKKVCSATLPIMVEQQNQRINLGAWILAHNNEGALLSVLQTPEIDVGVLVNRGIELKLGSGQPHKIGFVTCNPQRCESILTMDEAIIKEALAAANGPASITFWKADGAAFNINLQSIKGIDKAIGALR